MRQILVTVLFGLGSLFVNSLCHASMCSEGVAFGDDISHVCIRPGGFITLSDGGRITTYTCAHSLADDIEDKLSKLGEMKALENGTGIVVNRALGTIVIQCGEYLLPPPPVTPIPAPPIPTLPTAPPVSAPQL